MESTHAAQVGYVSAKIMTTNLTNLREEILSLKDANSAAEWNISVKGIITFY